MDKKLNVLLITSDQQHWNTLGFLNSEIHTPNLDQLAAQGMVFSRTYCPNPTCTPTRASMITGQYPSQHGAWSLGTKLMDDVHTVGEDFAAAGYRTALVGKAHFQPLASTEEFPSMEAYPILQDLEFWKEFNGPFYGFEHVELARNHTDEAHVGQHYALWMEEKGFASWRDSFRTPTGTQDAQEYSWDLPEEFHYNTWISDRTTGLLEDYQQNDENFFLWASFFDPHPSYLVPEPWASMYDPAALTLPGQRDEEHRDNPLHYRKTQEKNPDFSMYEEPGGNVCHGFESHLRTEEQLRKDLACYYGMVSCLDKYIGRILDRLDELGLAENTLVIFTTDHGHLFGQHGLVAKGAFNYEDLIRIPFIARLPESIAAASQSPAMQSLVDLAPTILDFCGLPIPRTMTGISQKPVWLGEAGGVRDRIMVENRHQPFLVNSKTYVDRRYKLTVYCGSDEGELFDLQEDPGEFYNRWKDPGCRELRSELMLKLIQAEMQKEPMPMPRISMA
ncbi:sulfatase family protein [Tichowtungia aerotolerans]|uniref:Sulfatase-like hydrolase/transferase n=1 Tax=Tichowtungia aerotolerans TaxID=2697043 RepID=A0A6P1M569_9BACT|nr:sulfatase-like hydrolase/transferase [Tichowtungia aerotolerans]QHI69939.1 sulfatase-like hydrolase/transferase [Tichowtungia aerotolerans]